MKIIIFSISVITVLGLSSLSTCSRPDQSNNGSGDHSTQLPICIQQKVDQILDQPVRNPAAKLYSYTFNGETVYYFPPYSGDFYSDLFNASCSLICHPDGGFTGMGDGNCPNFFSQRTNEQLLWTDPR